MISSIDSRRSSEQMVEIIILTVSESVYRIGNNIMCITFGPMQLLEFEQEFRNHMS